MTFRIRVFGALGHGELGWREGYRDSGSVEGAVRLFEGGGDGVFVVGGRWQRRKLMIEPFFGRGWGGEWLWGW